MHQIFNFQNQVFRLLAQKAIYWENNKTLILADLHLGKVSHFRKAGLAIPKKTIEKDYIVLEGLIAEYQPIRILILGDLFHSTYNGEWDIFGEFVKRLRPIQFDLVLGNHDILPMEKYPKIGINLLGEAHLEENIIFTHIPIHNVPENHFNFAGHIHPGFSIEGAGRQSVMLPCFYKNKGNLILPAFGHLTGLKGTKKLKSSKIFVINGSKVVLLQ